MRRLIFTLCVFVSLAINAEGVKILSLNNSLIDYNNQPAMFNEMCKAMDVDAQWSARTQLGRTLLFHYNDAVSRRLALGNTPWDYVILQEQSALPRNHPEVLMESVKLWHKAFDETSGDYYSEENGARMPILILPLNWAYSDWDEFKAQTAKLKRSYLDVERDLPGVKVCPVGVAYEIIFDREGPDGAATLYTDNRHPSLKASYLAACMELAVIADIDPATITYVPDGLDAKDAKAMRQVAADALREWKKYQSTSR